ncbi:MAG: hypothetical protein LBK99_03940 [Opitutaceae bacterium]|nr:hypothetical protein [Opitutaceae bacterium]
MLATAFSHFGRHPRQVFSRVTCTFGSATSSIYCSTASYPATGSAQLNGYISRSRTEGKGHWELLANIYLHWFDKAFHRKDGPAQYANARLVRYADDFVVMARYMGRRIVGWCEEKLESWLGLKINREKPRVIKATQEGQTVDFLGYSHRLERDLCGRDRKWWRQYPSKKAMRKQSDWLRENITTSHNREPLKETIERINTHYRGWKAYYNQGHPRREYRRLNWQIGQRLAGVLKRRSQRGYKLPEGISLYEHLHNLGLEVL